MTFEFAKCYKKLEGNIKLHPNDLHLCSIFVSLLRKSPIQPGDPTMISAVLPHQGIQFSPGDWRSSGSQNSLTAGRCSWPPLSSAHRRSLDDLTCWQNRGFEEISFKDMGLMVDGHNIVIFFYMKMLIVFIPRWFRTCFATYVTYIWPVQVRMGQVTWEIEMVCRHPSHNGNPMEWWPPFDHGKAHMWKKTWKCWCVHCEVVKIWVKWIDVVNPTVRHTWCYCAWGFKRKQ